jgi:transposase
MKKKRGRTAYSEEFRREAVRLVDQDTSALTQVARDLGVHPETLRAWWRRAQADRDGPIVPPTRVLSLEEENRRLRQENARLTEEREILKKAAAFFAKDAR